jgi:multidrug resistance efflux pump
VRRDILVTEHSSSETSEKRYFVKVLPTGEVFHFGEKEFFIFQSLDGLTPFEDIRVRFQAQFGIELSSDHFHGFLHELNRMGLLEGQAPPTGGRGRETFATQTRPRSSKAAPAAVRQPYRWPLFNPRLVLGALIWIFRPLHYLVWALIPGLLVAGLILFHRDFDLGRDLARITSDISALTWFLFGLFFVNLTSRLAMGAVAHSFGADVNEFGLRLNYGIILRFYVGKEPIRELPRQGQLWSFAAPLLMRLTIFSLGTFLWIGYRSTGTWFPDLALIVGQIGLGSFLFTANPLWPADGYNWMTVYFDQPKLRQRAFAALGFGRKTPRREMAGASSSRWPLVLFGIATILYMGAVATVFTLYLGVALEAQFQGTGVVMFLAVFSAVLLWLYVVRRTNKARKEQRIEEKMQGGWGDGLADEPVISGALVARKKEMILRSSTAVDFAIDLPPIKDVRRQPNWIKRLILLGLAAGLAYVAFLPYPYEPGGNFVVLPAQRIEVRARVDGEVMQILAQEGDWLEAGDVIAVLSSWDEERDLAVVEAELDKAVARLDQLERGPKAEEIRKAQKEVESVGVRVKFSKLDAERYATLLESGTVSRKTAENAMSEYEKAKADLAVARANLELVQSGSTQNELDVARAEVRRLSQERDFRADQLRRTRIEAPAAGRIVTPNLHLKRGMYLPVGGLFAEIEDNRVARAEIEVPETDIAEVGAGAAVKLKAWGAADAILLGSVVSIAPSAEPREYGLIVRVMTDIPNDDGFLKSQMTGYAKIASRDMPVWEAFSRMLMRFFKIEMWSWIP